MFTECTCLTLVLLDWSEADWVLCVCAFVGCTCLTLVLLYWSEADWVPSVFAFAARTYLTFSVLGWSKADRVSFVGLFAARTCLKITPFDRFQAYRVSVVFSLPGSWCSHGLIDIATVECDIVLITYERRSCGLGLEFDCLAVTQVMMLSCWHWRLRRISAGVSYYQNQSKVRLEKCKMGGLVDQLMPSSQEKANVGMMWNLCSNQVSSDKQRKQTKYANLKRREEEI